MRSTLTSASAPLLALAIATPCLRAQSFAPDFEPATSIQISTSAYAAAFGDFDSDGAIDLAVSTQFGLEIHSNDGHGHFALSATASGANWYAEDVAVGDLDGDGRLDCVGIDRVREKLLVALGDGNGAFSSSFEQPVGLTLAADAIGIAAGDLDGDGRDDVVVSGSAQDAGLVFKSLAGGVFGSPTTCGPATQPNEVALGDLNGDGELDLVLPGWAGISTMLGNGDGTFGAPQHFVGAGGVYGLSLADLDGDGRVDVCAARASAYQAVVLRSTGDGSLTQQATLQLFDSGSGAAPVVCDLSRDGRLDIAVATGSAYGVLRTFVGGATPFEFAPSTFVNTAVPLFSVSGDVHGDAAPDVVIGALAGSNPELLVNRTQASNAGFSFCEAKLNSSNCLPSLHGSGVSSASSASGFVVTCSQLLNQRASLFFYSSTGAGTHPFLGGTSCVRAPLRRTPTQSSGGAAAPILDCSGSIALDLNAFAARAAGGSPAPELAVVGTEIAVQAYSRDPQSTAFASLSDGFVYSVGP